MLLHSVLDISEHIPTEDMFYKGQKPQGDPASGGTHRLHQQMVPDPKGQGATTCVSSVKH